MQVNFWTEVAATASTHKNIGFKLPIACESHRAKSKKPDKSPAFYQKVAETTNR
tara:strand:- start:120 stop:281 length:162 start_codon:yes stop_codon:yes gene_type:complete